MYVPLFYLYRTSAVFRLSGSAMYIAYLAWAMVCSSRALQLHEITSQIIRFMLNHAKLPSLQSH